MLCFYSMGLNLLNRQIAGELGLAVSDVQAMAGQLRRGLVATMPAVELGGEVEIDEVCVVAGHKGQPKEVGRLGRCRKLVGAPGRGTLEKDKPPILGLIQRGGQVVLRMLANVQQRTIRPVIAAAVAPGTLIHTDQYSIYARLPAWGSAMDVASMSATRTGTASARSTSTPWKASGRCCAPGCARTVASRKTSCRSILASSSPCTTRIDAAKPCPAPSLRPWSHDASAATPEPDKSHREKDGGQAQSLVCASDGCAARRWP